MPKASDGKYFPYTKQGILAYKAYEAKLNRNNKDMGSLDNPISTTRGQIRLSNCYLSLQIFRPATIPEVYCQKLKNASKINPYCLKMIFCMN